MSDNNLQKAGIGMELTKQEKKEQKKREKEEKKRQKAENKTPMDPAKKKKLSRGAYLARWQESLCCSS